MKNFLIKSICLVLVTVTTFSLCGCFETVREYDVGDFRVVLALGQKDRKDPNNYLNLVGLSEAGKQKKIIVLPKKINGHPYYLLFQSTPGSANTVFQGKMEKFYFEYPGNYSQYSKDARLEIGVYYTGYLKKVIINTTIKLGSVREDVGYYFNYNRYYSGKYRKEIKLANLQFLYNYNESPNEGYFWIDDIDNGEKVEVIPDTPEREGYTFGGWYMEEDCENKFDFNTVFNKPVLEKGDIYPDDYVTYLYAKWTKNEG